LLLPLDIGDENLNEARLKPRLPNEQLTNVSSAIHLFKLTKFASEIKMVLYCIERVYPPYTKPAITDYPQWRQDMVKRLKQWRDEIPKHANDYPPSHLVTICEIRYHEVMMLTLRPSPLFRKPSHEAIRHCLESAVICIELYEKPYLSNSLKYSWTGVHSLFLRIMTIFYCFGRPGTMDFHHSDLRLIGRCVTKNVSCRFLRRHRIFSAPLVNIGQKLEGIEMF
jgi:hypothetical protein